MKLPYASKEASEEPPIRSTSETNRAPPPNCEIEPNTNLNLLRSCITMPPKKKIEPGATPIEAYSYAHIPRPFKNAAWQAGKGPRKAKAVKNMLLGERDREVQEVERLRKFAAEASMKMDVDNVDGGDLKMDGQGIQSNMATPLYCYSTIEAPPSLIPQRRYCDITGLEALYTDPATGLRYHDKDVYAHIKTLKPAAVQAYLSLRGGGQPVIV